ncbi:hypothetical protein EDEG_02102 [Edhazardia aedis USNM 41457]|uniref:Uncharacterized protein n=1 Tax=Edhazardia aedis (strain USNM 41457) TaxID=1003232 RepID=J9D729_EDHAE|nr:hypothetical protein EDEG_02102 [Edhazardia aedis USNM 41457]|eukprot:EJW03571.1 hypothetical protein EDEG_02102 [Edhazardia aedis USNM 41457]
MDFRIVKMTKDGELILPDAIRAQEKLKFMGDSNDENSTQNEVDVSSDDTIESSNSSSKGVSLVADLNNIKVLGNEDKSKAGKNSNKALSKGSNQKGSQAEKIADNSKIPQDKISEPKSIQKTPLQYLQKSEKVPTADPAQKADAAVKQDSTVKVESVVNKDAIGNKDKVVEQEPKVNTEVVVSKDTTVNKDLTVSKDPIVDKDPKISTDQSVLPQIEAQATITDNTAKQNANNTNIDSNDNKNTVNLNQNQNYTNNSNKGNINNTASVEIPNTQPQVQQVQQQQSLPAYYATNYQNAKIPVENAQNDQNNQNIQSPAKPVKPQQYTLPQNIPKVEAPTKPYQYTENEKNYTPLEYSVAPNKPALKERKYDILADKNYKTIQYIDEGIILSLLFVYVFWRLIKNRNFSLIKLFKGNMKSVSVFFLFFSNIFMLAYNVSIIYLTKFYDFDKGVIEKVGYLAGTHIITLYNNTFDIVKILNVCLTMHQILRTSTLFCLIGLWLPSCLFALKKNSNSISLFNIEKSISKIGSENSLHKALGHASIVTFANLYCFLRIPLSIILDFNHSVTSDKTVIFYRSVFYGTETYVLILFFLLLETKFMSLVLRKDDTDLRKSFKPAVENVNLLVVLLGLIGFLKYYINVMALPVEMNNLCVHIVSKIVFVTEICVTLLVVHMLSYNFNSQEGARNRLMNSVSNDKLGWDNIQNVDVESANGTSFPCLPLNETASIVEFSDVRDSTSCGK